VPSDHEARPDGFRSDVRDAFLARRLDYPYRKSLTSRLLSRLVGLMPERVHSWLYTYFYLPWVEHGKLLEIGTGSGWQLARMKAAGWSVLGLDFDADAVAVARDRGLDMKIGDVRELGLEAGSFDAIVMAHVVEHVHDPVGLLRECQRLLKPGGRLIAITPNAGSLGHRLYGASWRGLEPPRHIAVFTPSGLRVACARADLQVESIRVTARDAANLLLASARMKHAGKDGQIERPRFGQRPPRIFGVIAAIERLGNLFGLGLGEELVLTARSDPRPA
jgi:2-polyprenyl-3-methyl-5-hydroxy-6-metoxy-1,4-benzoquinol methylase